MVVPIDVEVDAIDLEWHFKYQKIIVTVEF